jgi:hypothetical protein
MSSIKYVNNALVYVKPVVGQLLQDIVFPAAIIVCLIVLRALAIAQLAL